MGAVGRVGPSGKIPADGVDPDSTFPKPVPRCRKGWLTTPLPAIAESEVHETGSAAIRGSQVVGGEGVGGADGPLPAALVHAARPTFLKNSWTSLVKRGSLHDG